MTNIIPLAPADIEFQLSASIAVGATSFTLSSATDDDGNALAAGLYCFTINNGKSNKEYLMGDLSGTTVSNVVSISRQGVSSSGAANAHRVGDPVIISNFASIQRTVDALRGQIDIDGSNPISYDADPTFNQDQQIITKKYADDLAIAGAPDSTDSVKGIGERATTAEIDAGTADGSGDTTAPLFVSAARLAGSIYNSQLPTADEKAALDGTGTPSSTNKFVTEDLLTGMVIPYAGSSEPTGWLLCSGQAVSRTTYADLFTLIGTTYGVGDGSTTFNVPDMRGNFPLGKDNMGGSSRNRVTATEADTLGDEEGAETHTLTESEIPDHTHDIQGATAAGSGTSGFDRLTNNGSASDLTTKSSSAGGGAHNNMPPYMTLNYLIKT